MIKLSADKCKISQLLFVVCVPVCELCVSLSTIFHNFKLSQEIRSLTIISGVNFVLRFLQLLSFLQSFFH